MNGGTGYRQYKGNYLLLVQGMTGYDIDSTFVISIAKSVQIHFHLLSNTVHIRISYNTATEVQRVKE